MPESTTAKEGFALIAAVLALLVFCLALTFATLSFSLGLNQTALAVQSGAKALALAEGCTEEALYQVSLDPNFDAERITLPEGECSLDRTQDGSNYTLTLEATLEGHTRRIRADANRGVTGMELLAWSEI